MQARPGKAVASERLIYLRRTSNAHELLGASPPFGFFSGSKVPIASPDIHDSQSGIPNSNILLPLSPSLRRSQIFGEFVSDAGSGSPELRKFFASRSFRGCFLEKRF
jgi:hypothetical protein